jgi:hypothetical protein
MSHLMLIEGAHQNQEYVEKIAIQYGFKICDENQNLCVIKHVSNGKIVAVLGFNSDAGTDYVQNEHETLSVEHEILHLEPESFVLKEDGIAELITHWLYKYLLQSALSSKAASGSDYGSQIFHYQFKRDAGRILPWATETFNHGLFLETLAILGYKNKAFTQSQ